MAYLRQILHIIHLACFSFILGNMITDYIFGNRKYEKEQYPLLGKTYQYCWLGMIVTGIWQIMVISKQHNYLKNKKYGRWVLLLFIKTIFTLVSAYGLELIAKIFVPEKQRRVFLKYSRIGCFLALFLYSSIVREFRETQLRKKDKEKGNKSEVKNEKNE